MDCESTEEANTPSQIQGISIPHIPMSNLSLHSDDSNAASPGCVPPHPTIPVDEDIYSEKEEGEISTDDEDSRAGDWEPNLEYGDTLMVESFYHPRSLEVLTSEKTSTSIQSKRQADFVDPSSNRLINNYAKKRIKLKRNIKRKRRHNFNVMGDVDWSELPGYDPMDASTYKISAYEAKGNELRVQSSQQRNVWIQLAKALATARQDLEGDDLELFEVLVEKPAPGVNPIEKIDQWVRNTCGNKTKRTDEPDQKKNRSRYHDRKGR